MNIIQILINYIYIYTTESKLPMCMLYSRSKKSVLSIQSQFRYELMTIIFCTRSDVKESI